MTFLQALILLNIQKIKGSRTVYSIYHLLKGKKSSQTIQDAHLFKLGVFFQTFPFLQRDVFEEMIMELEKKNLICQKENQKFYISKYGEKELHDFFEKRPFPKYLNGLKYQDIAITFWKRINLLIQVLSNSIHEINRYSPIQRDEDIQQWVKSFLKESRYTRPQLSDQLYHEIASLFLKHSPENPEILVIRLTGNNQFGKTIDQAAEYFLMENTEYWYRFIHLLHYMLETMILNKSEFSFLYSLISDTYRNIPLTKSTVESLILLKKGYSIPEVANLRRLKESTIEDHVIEIVLNDTNFDISPYLQKELEQKIIKIANSVTQKKLKPIKDAIGDVSYFQIRLALAKQGVWE
ncbi:helix-turn-helix domain-containing protein [Heyndrickxia sp. NPDC080065]|uniref:helix-turn-helix domain-containing protein n=1 Tax=Heyndrickxia sp. NPDC080065 TaxID=3390568 RepID=UPI003D08FAA8